MVTITDCMIMIFAISVKKSSHIYKIRKLENIWNELQWPFSLRPHYGKRKLQEERPIWDKATTDSIYWIDKSIIIDYDRIHRQQKYENWGALKAGHWKRMQYHVFSTGSQNITNYFKCNWQSCCVGMDVRFLPQNKAAEFILI